MKTGEWIRTVDVGGRREGRGHSREDWQALGAEEWLDSQSAAPFVSAATPGGLRVPRGWRGSTLLTRVSRSCVAKP